MLCFFPAIVQNKIFSNHTDESVFFLEFISKIWQRNNLGMLYTF